jgi:hypothetical protein
MGLLDGLEPPQKTYSCRIRTLFGELDAKDIEILKEALADEKTWSINGLKVALAVRGIKVSTDAINRHRQGACNCSKT